VPGIYYQDGANQRAASALYYQDGASLRTITEAWYQDGANLRKIWPAAVVALTNHSPTTFAGGGTATASFIMDNTGVASGVGTSGGGTYSGEWMIVGPASAYDVRFTIVSGALTSGTAGSWLNLATSRTWTVQRGTPGTNMCQGTVEIRDATTLAVLATAAITLTADRA
jgi:hypothetical protein